MVDLCVEREFSNHDVSKIKNVQSTIKIKVRYIYVNYIAGSLLFISCLIQCLTNTEAKEVVMEKIKYTKKKQGCSSLYIWYSEMVNLFRQ